MKLIVVAFTFMFVLNIFAYSQSGTIQNNSVKFEPEDGRVYHGAQTMTYESGSDPLAGYLGALSDSTQPAVRGIFFSIPGTRGADKSLTALSSFLASAETIGFIPELSLFFMDTSATDSIIAVSNKYDNIIDSIISICKSYGKKMFLRIGGEFNGKGPGWNGGGYHPYYYVTMFRKITDMFTAKGLRDSIAVIWCYEPDAANDFDSEDAKGYLWYPGDEYVDWFGLDVFDVEHFDQSQPDTIRGAITRKGKSERFLAMARSKSRPVFMSETSAKGINIGNEQNDGINDWNNWFVKFWDFIDTHKEIKGFSYIDANWPRNAYPDWGDARIQNSPYVTEKYNQEMSKSKYIHLPGKLSSINNNFSFKGDIIIYPNPASDNIMIKGITGVAKIIDMMGREVWRGEINDYSKIDISNLCNGLYFCQFQYFNYYQTKRIDIIR